MASDSYTHTFTWAGEGNHVVATGTFDNWSSSLTLNKHDDGKFSATKDLPYGEKIQFKYVVDGTWRHNPDEPHETDGSGNVNNVFAVPPKPEAASLPVTATDATVVAIPAAAVPSETVETEKPLDPAPTPAVTHAGETSIPTVPSDADVAAAVPSSDLASNTASTESAHKEKTDAEESVATIAAASAGAILAGAALFGQKAYEAAGAAVEQGKEALGYHHETPAADIAKDGANVVSSKAQELTSSSKNGVANDEGETSFGTSTLAALGLGNKEETTSSSVPHPNAASTSLPVSEAPVAPKPENPDTTITSVPVSEAPASSALTTAGAGETLAKEESTNTKTTTSAAVSDVPVDKEVEKNITPSAPVSEQPKTPNVHEGLPSYLAKTSVEKDSNQTTSTTSASPTTAPSVPAKDTTNVSNPSTPIYAANNTSSAPNSTPVKSAIPVVPSPSATPASATTSSPAVVADKKKGSIGQEGRREPSTATNNSDARARKPSFFKKLKNALGGSPKK